MKLSDLIDLLNTVQDISGDLTVEVDSDGFPCVVESLIVNDDYGTVEISPTVMEDTICVL